MTDPVRFALSAEIQEWMKLAPELVAQFQEVPVVDHDPPETFEGLTWFVVVTNIKCERRAQLGLRRKGYQTYLPQTKRWRTHARKKEAVEYPLFPRYMFIGLRPGQDFYKMASVDGVEALLRDGYGSPVQIPGPKAKDGEEHRPHPLARLLDREQAGEFDFTREPEKGPTFEPGESVLVGVGVLAGQQALVTAMLAKGRVKMLVEFMGGLIPAEIAATELQRLEAAE